MNKMLVVSIASSLAIAGPSDVASAQVTAQCEAYQRIVKTPAPTMGALASLEHTVAVLRAAIAIIDEPCGAPYIVSTDRAAIAQQRAQLYAAWQQARANCLQLTSGEPNDDSPCKAEVGAD